MHHPSSQLSSALPSSLPENPQRPQTAEPDPAAANSTDVDETRHDDFIDEVIMAMNVSSNGSVGCCHYNVQDEKLSLLSDVSCGGLEVVDTGFYHTFALNTCFTNKSQ